MSDQNRATVFRLGLCATAMGESLGAPLHTIDTDLRSLYSPDRNRSTSLVSTTTAYSPYSDFIRPLAIIRRTSSSVIPSRTATSPGKSTPMASLITGTGSGEFVGR